MEWSKVLDLAEEQSVVGLLAAGIERFKVKGSRFLNRLHCSLLDG